MAVLRERWTGQRLVLVLTGLVGYHVVYLCYRNLKSWNAFNQLRDHDLLAFDKALFLGHHPAALLHTLVGEEYAAEALAVVYRSFTYVIVLALVGSLALIPRVRRPTSSSSAATWAWILGTFAYYVLPSLGPYAAAPRVRRAPARRSPRPRPSTSPSGPPSSPTHGCPTRSSAWGAFASLHVGFTTLVLLMARYYGLRRTPECSRSTWPSSSCRPSTSAGTTSPTTSRGPHRADGGAAGQVDGLPAALPVGPRGSRRDRRRRRAERRARSPARRRTRRACSSGARSWSRPSWPACCTSCGGDCWRPRRGHRRPGRLGGVRAGPPRQRLRPGLVRRHAPGLLQRHLAVPDGRPRCATHDGRGRHPAAGLLALLLERSPHVRHPMLPAVFGALALTGNAVSGRVTFGLGLLFGLAALVAAFAWPARLRLRVPVIVALAALTTAASAVAGLLLGLVAAALWLTGERRLAYAIGLPPLVVVAVSAWLFPLSGVQPMSWYSALLPTAAGLSAVLLFPATGGCCGCSGWSTWWPSRWRGWCPPPSAPTSVASA